jgi:hypothetical protein
MQDFAPNNIVRLQRRFFGIEIAAHLRPFDADIPRL